MLSDMLPFLHIRKDHTVSLTEKSGNSASLHSCPHFWIYSVDEKKDCSVRSLSLILFHYEFFSASRNVFEFLFTCLLSCYQNQDAIFKSDIHFSGIFFFLLRKEKQKYQSPYKETLRAHGPSKWWVCVFISFYWKTLMHQSGSATKRSKSQKRKFTFISLYNILRSVIWQNYRSG